MKLNLFSLYDLLCVSYKIETDSDVANDTLLYWSWVNVRLNNRSYLKITETYNPQDKVVWNYFRVNEG